MANEIEEYQAAKKAHESAINACELAANKVHAASDALKNWRKAMVSNSSSSYPVEIALNKNTPSIDANSWISAHEIGTKLANFHTTKSAMTQAYSSIPEGQRDVVVPPPA